jgi:hypothetical protein
MKKTMSNKLDTAVRLFRQNPIYFFAYLADRITNHHSFFQSKIDVKVRDVSKVVNSDQLSLQLEAVKLYSQCITQKKSSINHLPSEINEFISLANLQNFVSDDRRLSLETLFSFYGSDKASSHNYSYVYQPIIDSVLISLRSSNVRISEIGLGTNNLDVPSNMGFTGSPGASCRAFRDYDPNIWVYGGDVDRRILFSDDRINTQYVNQLDLDSLCSYMLLTKPHILIDDGLHTPRANFNVLAAALEYKASSGDELSEFWLIIEDIATSDHITSFWLSVLSILPSYVSPWLLKTRSSSMLVIKL